jgi:hypothetical protein
MSDEVAGRGSDDDVLVIESLTLRHLEEAVDLSRAYSRLRVQLRMDDLHG